MNNDTHTPDETLKQAYAIYFAALEIESEVERITFINNSCSENSAVRKKVDKLLSLEEKASQIFAERSPNHMSVSDIIDKLPEGAKFFGNIQSEKPSDSEIGKQIGPYTLLQKIGEGGVGNVYLAEQTKPVRRQVALKIIKAGMDTKSVIARFEAERQTLAMMDHPNIAHVLNAGETETGRPFFVMELVHGQRITTYCDLNALTVRQRLKLFVQVCNAIQHAHQKGVIHRDIKPSNVLITKHDESPHPVVIDFGIAKATGEDLLANQTVNTSIGPLIGTPAYMSPEQTNLNKLDIDTRSDIYSLGVLLYELLIGSPPFDQEDLLKSGIEDMCRTLRECDPPVPSAKLLEISQEEFLKVAANRNIDPKRLSTILTGDLDWIVMKALEKDRSRRYESASELALDTERFLHDEPVMARPPSRIYRLQKLIRRNKTTFISMTIATVALLAGLGTSTWLFLRERQVSKSESLLRTEANARAKISQAALLLSRGMMVDADALAASVEPVAVEPSMEVAEVYRTLGNWHIRNGVWVKAAERFSKLTDVNRVDGESDREQIGIDLVSAAAALAAAGQITEYQRFINEYLSREFISDDPLFTEQIMSASILVDVTPETLNLLLPLKNTLESSVLNQSPRNQSQIYHSARRKLSLALLYYRSGDNHNALRLAKDCLNLRTQSPARNSLTHIVLAMSYAELGYPINARYELALGRDNINNTLQNGLDDIPQIAIQNPSAWHDWVIGYLLLQEAESLINPIQLTANIP